MSADEIRLSRERVVPVWCNGRSSVVVRPSVASTDRVLQAMKEAFQGSIDLTYPTTPVLFHDQTEETDGDRTRQREGWPAPDGHAPKPRDLLGALQVLGARRESDQDRE